MVYNMTNVTAAKNVFEMFGAVNSIANDWVARMFLIGLFFIIFIMIVWNTGEALKAYISACFVALMLSGLFYLLDFVSGVEPLIIFVLFTSGIIILYLGGLKKNV